MSLRQKTEFLHSVFAFIIGADLYMLILRMESGWMIKVWDNSPDYRWRNSKEFLTTLPGICRDRFQSEDWYITITPQCSIWLGEERLPAVRYCLYGGWRSQYLSVLLGKINNFRKINRVQEMCDAAWDTIPLQKYQICEAIYGEPEDLFLLEIHRILYQQMNRDICSPARIWRAYEEPQNFSGRTWFMWNYFSFLISNSRFENLFSLWELNMWINRNGFQKFLGQDQNTLNLSSDFNAFSENIHKNWLRISRVLWGISF